VTGPVVRARALQSWQVTLGVALLALGFLIAAQLQSEGPRVRYTTQEREPLIQTALGLQAQQDQLKERILATRDRIAALEQRGQGSAALVRQLNGELDTARTAAGVRTPDLGGHAGTIDFTDEVMARVRARLEA
jgi:uncharacterized protein YlxW (UPF0749 family)